jgi:hypothetical protein
MSKTGEECKVPPPPLDEDDNEIVDVEGSKLGPSKPPTLEELMKKLEKLKTENEKHKAKDKKGKTYSYSSEDGDSTFEEEFSNKWRKGRKSTISPPIRLCLSITITCLALPLILPYPLAKLHILMGQTIINESIA